MTINITAIRLGQLLWVKALNTLCLRLVDFRFGLGFLPPPAFADFFVDLAKFYSRPSPLIGGLAVSRNIAGDLRPVNQPRCQRSNNSVAVAHGPGFSTSTEINCKRG